MERIKSWLILLLAAGLAVSLTVNILNRGRHKEHTGMPTPTVGSPISAPIKDTYTDKAGRQHVVIDARANEQIRSGAVAIAAPIAATIDSLKNALAIKAKQVEGYTGVVFAASRDSVRFMKAVIDSLRRTTRTYRDKYLNLIVRDPQSQDSTDKGSFDFAYDADLKFVDYWKRRRVFGLPIGLKEYFTDISSSDDRMHIKGVNKFTFRRKAPLIGVRGQAMGAYNFRTDAYSLGGGIRLDVADFNTSFNYLYNFQLKEWTPTLLFRYDIVQVGR